MELTNEHKRHLYEQGYVKLPGAVPRERVHTALRAINASLGGNGIDPAQLPTFRSQSYAPELRRSPAILGLLTESSLWSAVESLIGAGQVAPVSDGQIALRFPILETPKTHAPHLDGMYSPNNGVPAGTIGNFTLLVGVFLSDLPEINSGNFTLWPGTHRLFETYFREHGPQSLLNGMPPVDMPAPVQVTAQPGDAVLCHYQLAHTITSNGSPNIRYAIFFRLKRVNHESVKWDCMTDIWLEWDGMREVVGAQVDHERRA